MTKAVTADSVKVDFRTKGNPEPDPNDLVRDALIKAKTSIDATVYKLTKPGVFKELTNAAKRGVEIRMIFNADTMKKYPFAKVTRLAKRETVQIKTWPTKGDQKLHMKMLVVDRERVVTGSFNWNESAEGPNAELLIRFRGADIGEAFAELFDELWIHKGVRDFPRAK